MCYCASSVNKHRNVRRNKKVEQRNVACYRQLGRCKNGNPTRTDRRVSKCWDADTDFDEVNASKGRNERRVPVTSCRVHHLQWQKNRIFWPRVRGWTREMEHDLIRHYNDTDQSTTRTGVFIDAWRSLYHKQTCTVTVIHYCTDNWTALAPRSITSRSSRIAICDCPTCIRRPRPLGCPVGILPRRLVWKNYNGFATRRWKKICWRNDYSFWRNSRTRRTDTQTDRHRLIA